jgi:hypothetical protein
MDADELLKRYEKGERNFKGISLVGVNLPEVNLSEVNLSEADLSEANLSLINLRKANLFAANLRKANLSEANLSCACLKKANLVEANLIEANLTDTNLTEANLTQVNLGFAVLKGANFAEANLCHAFLIGTNLTKACLSNAALFGAVMPDDSRFVIGSSTSVNSHTENTQLAHPNSTNPHNSRDPKFPDRETQTLQNLVFKANLQEFAQQVSDISALETNGKLSLYEAYEQIKALWQQLEAHQKQLGINSSSPASELESDNS